VPRVRKDLKNSYEYYLAKVSSINCIAMDLGVQPSYEMNALAELDTTSYTSDEDEELVARYHRLAMELADKIPQEDPETYLKAQLGVLVIVVAFCIRNKMFTIASRHIEDAIADAEGKQTRCNISDETILSLYGAAAFIVEEMLD
jgi:hypothetical protein